MQSVNWLLVLLPGAILLIITTTKLTTTNNTLSCHPLLGAAVQEVKFIFTFTSSNLADAFTSDIQGKKRKLSQGEDIQSATRMRLLFVYQLKPMLRMRKLLHII